MRVEAALALTALAAVSQAQGADALLERARKAMETRLASTPNYTCQLEIDRYVFAGAATGRYRTKEAARLEVSVVGGRENFAWPGESAARESLEDFLGPGLSSTGEFSAHGRSTFLDGRTLVERLPDERQTEAGRAGYAYSVPLEASRYAVSGGAEGARAPYEGELWVESDSGQLVRLDVRVPAPPESSGVRRIDSFVLYERREISGREAWLPSEARVVVESSAGRTFRNDLRFESCRAFQAEATIRFDAEAPDGVETEGPSRNVIVPEGLEIELELTTAFDSERTRAGDSFEGRLLQAAPQKGEPALPGGAEVRGRVKRLALIDAGPGAGPGRPGRRVATLTLELLEVRWPGHCGRLSATLVMVDKIPRMAPVNPDGLQLPRAFYNSERALGYRTAPRLSAEGSGTFVVLGDLYEVPAGARMRWRTGAPPAEACAAHWTPTSGAPARFN